MKRTVGLELRNQYAIHGSTGFSVNLLGDFEQVILPLGLRLLGSQGLQTGECVKGRDVGLLLPFPTTSWRSFSFS